MDVVLKLPEELVKQAQAAGILTDEQVANLLEAELERRERRQTFFADMQTLQAQQPPLSSAEIEAELIAFRQARDADRDK